MDSYSYTTMVATDGTKNPPTMEFILIIRKNGPEIIHTQRLDGKFMIFDYDPESQIGTAGEISWTLEEVTFDSGSYPFDESFRGVLKSWKSWVTVGKMISV